MQSCRKKLLCDFTSPGLLYLTLDNHDPIYVGFQHRLKLEVCLISQKHDLAPQMLPSSNTQTHQLGSSKCDEGEKDCNILQDDTDWLKSNVYPSSDAEPLQLPSLNTLEICGQDSEMAAEGEDDALESFDTGTSSALHSLDNASGQGGFQRPYEVGTSHKLSPVYTADLVATSPEQQPLSSTATVSAKSIEEPLQQKWAQESASSAAGVEDCEESMNCVYCSTTFPTKREFYKHRRSQSEEYHLCLKCQTAFPFEAYLRVHMKYHDVVSPKATYACESCPYVAKSISELKRHFLIHTREFCFQCCQCSKQYATQKSLMAHLESMHRPKGLFKCSCCNIFFSTRGKLHNHLIAKRVIDCGICGEAFPNKITRTIHIRSQHPESLKNCHMCPATFETEERLEKHLKNHARYKKKPCPECGLSVINMRQHLQTHESQTSYLCEICSAKFSTLQTFLSHKDRKHSGKTHKCHQCSYCATSASQLYRHIFNVQSDIRPHQCEICGHRSKKKCNLKIHMRIHSNVKVFPCSYCDQGFNYKASLLSHIRSKNPREWTMNNSTSSTVVESNAASS